MRGDQSRKNFSSMFRIDLIKVISLWLVLIPVFALAGNGKKKIVDPSGIPIPHAVIQVDGLKPIPVNSNGELEAELPAGKAIVVFALGYDSFRFSWDEWLKVDEIILREKTGALQEVVVSATRTDRTVENLPLPVTVITSEQVQETGGLRLSEVLREQTGLQISSDHGSGLQMQGLDSEYILILLDGEPLIGRTAGTFDLDRISVSNIDRIEILRGPSSALYGSEAMAGVVNIITKGAKDGRKMDVGLRHRSFNSWNPYAELGFKTEKLRISAIYDYLRSDGFDLTPETVGQTQNPFSSQTAQVKITRIFSPKWEMSLFTRGYLESSTGQMQSGVSGALLGMENIRRDFNLNPTLRFKSSEKWLFTLRTMSSQFSTQSNTRFLADGTSFDFQEFRQFYHRTEQQTDYGLDARNLFTLGLGHLVESVEATRYDDKNRFDLGYFFIQHQWDPNAKVNVLTGMRGDFHSQFGSRLSPKVAAQLKFSEEFSWQASLGAGFKAPDFRQMLLNFNNAASGYYVFGANLAEEGVARLQREGLVASILVRPETLGDLQAENSLAVNTGFRWKPSVSALLVVNGFRNQIENLIETAPIAQLVTGQNAFSYFNIRSVITQGVEADFSMNLTNLLRISAGYAFLDTRDTQVLDRIDAGELFKRNDQNITSRVRRADYGGLFNRSRHSGNVKINYTEPLSGTEWSLRGIYRGKFGFADLNGNLTLDDPSEYAPGWLSVNLTVTKTFTNGLFLEAGGTNLLNITTPAQPNNPGRMLFLGCRITLENLLN